MLYKLIKHIKKGTLINAIQYKISVLKWNQLINGKEFVPYVYDVDINLKLYTDSKLSRVLYENIFEQEELSFYKNYIKKGFNILDIGANIGLHVLYGAKLSGPKGMVYAFEPVKKTYERLTENISMNMYSNIHTYNLAISNTNGESKITTSLDGFDAWNSMAGRSNDTGSNFVEETIQTKTLDSFIESELKDTKIDFVKIDTEGWEFNVLIGGGNFFKTNDPIIMIEYAEDICKSFNMSTEDIYDKLIEFGYRLYKYNHYKDTFKEVSREEKFGVANLIASKSSL